MGTSEVRPGPVRITTTPCPSWEGGMGRKGNQLSNQTNRTVGKWGRVVVG